MIFFKNKMDKMEMYLKKLKTELVMKNYLNGWYIKWLEDKIKEVEKKIGLKKHNFNDD